MRDDETIQLLTEAMRARHGIDPENIRFVRAPYRICPLGAHIDHQHGTVTAMAIDQGVTLAYTPSGSNEVRFASANYPGEVRFSIDAIPSRQAGDWGNYARGAAMALARRHSIKQGLLGMTAGGLAEVGLSSSASIGLAYLLALEATNGLFISHEENIRLDQVVENEYLGLNNGILDQAAILLSRRNHLTVINCREFARAGERGPSDPAAAHGLPHGATVMEKSPAMPPFAILLAVSGLTQSIVSTDYNRRVAECADAARILLAAAGRPDMSPRLGAISNDEYEAFRPALAGAPARRAAHFFTEMRRVRLGQDAWHRGDLAAFAKLTTESGLSSIENYECGCAPLIDLYELLVHTDGVLGARFSGAGFRGCCLALVDPAAVESIIPEIQRAYAARHPQLARRAQCLVCQTDDGARLL